MKNYKQCVLLSTAIIACVLSDSRNIFATSDLIFETSKTAPAADETFHHCSIGDKTLSYTKGYVPGDGDCAFHATNYLGKGKSIDRKDFIAFAITMIDHPEYKDILKNVLCNKESIKDIYKAYEKSIRGKEKDRLDDFFFYYNLIITAYSGRNKWLEADDFRILSLAKEKPIIIITKDGKIDKTVFVNNCFNQGHTAQWFEEEVEEWMANQDPIYIYSDGYFASSGGASSADESFQGMHYSPIIEFYLLDTPVDDARIVMASDDPIATDLKEPSITLDQGDQVSAQRVGFTVQTRTKQETQQSPDSQLCANIFFWKTLSCLPEIVMNVFTPRINVNDLLSLLSNEFLDTKNTNIPLQCLDALKDRALKPEIRAEIAAKCLYWKQWASHHKDVVELVFTLMENDAVSAATRFKLVSNVIGCSYLSEYDDFMTNVGLNLLLAQINDQKPTSSSISDNLKAKFIVNVWAKPDLSHYYPDIMQLMIDHTIV